MKLILDVILVGEMLKSLLSPTKIQNFSPIRSFKSSF